MRRSLKILTVATALVVGIAAAPAIYAQSTGGTTGSTMAPMMGQDNMPMGQGNMMGMMKQMMKTITPLAKIKASRLAS